MLRAFKSVVLGDIEEIPYTVNKKLEQYEERKYPVTKYVCTKLTSTGRDTVNREMFMKLFGYINGENEGGVQIKMTAPVVTKVEPADNDENSKLYTMAFYMPKNFQENELPAPKNPDVFIDTWPEMTIFTRTFGGYAKDLQNKAEKAALEDLAKDEPDVIKEHYYEVGYDPPFKPLYRRNEIWLVKKQE